MAPRKEVYMLMAKLEQDFTLVKTRPFSDPGLNQAMDELVSQYQALSEHDDSDLIQNRLNAFYDAFDLHLAVVSVQKKLAEIEKKPHLISK